MLDNQRDGGKGNLEWITKNGSIGLGRKMIDVKNHFQKVRR